MQAQYDLRDFYSNAANAPSSWNTIDPVRIPEILKMLPESGVETVLEIGVSGGKIFKELCKKYSAAVGIDISLRALLQIDKGYRVNANARSLPFKDNVFDMTVIAEVLEHLLDRELSGAVKEAARVTKHYLLINSPYRDEINGPVAKCLRCSREFNVYGHLRSFSEKRLSNLFQRAGFVPVKTITLGPRRAWRNNCLLWLGRKLGKAYSGDYTTCPYCNKSDAINPKRNLFDKCMGRVFYSIQVFADMLIPAFFKPRAEIAILFEKLYD